MLAEQTLLTELFCALPVCFKEGLLLLQTLIALLFYLTVALEGSVEDEEEAQAAGVPGTVRTTGSLGETTDSSISSATPSAWA